jgi:hypothetical protein
LFGGWRNNNTDWISNWLVEKHQVSSISDRSTDKSALDKPQRPGFKTKADSHASRTPLSISKFGKGHASRGRLSNLPSVTQGSKLPVRPQKAKIFISMSKISLVSRQILAVVEMLNWFFGSRVTPSVDLNEILQYSAIVGVI